MIDVVIRAAVRSLALAASNLLEASELTTGTSLEGRPCVTTNILETGRQGYGAMGKLDDATCGDDDWET